MTTIAEPAMNQRQRFLGAVCYFALTTWWEGNPYHEFRRLLADTRAGARV